MKVTLFMAMSANGMIARVDGDEDFLSDANWQSVSLLVSRFNNFITGRKTYEAVKSWKESYGFDDFVDATKIVVSKDPAYSLDKGYTLASSPENALDIMQQLGFDNVFLLGGGTNNSSFAKAGLIDEIIFNVEPTIIGRGILVFQADDFQFKLVLIEYKRLQSGLMQLRYQVDK